MPMVYMNGGCYLNSMAPPFLSLAYATPLWNLYKYVCVMEGGRVSEFTTHQYQNIFKIDLILQSDATLCDKVCQSLATGRWFSPDTLVSSTNKTDSYDTTEILLKVALNTITLTLT